jgi:hypothetical protein
MNTTIAGAATTTTVTSTGDADKSFARPGKKKWKNHHD